LELAKTPKQELLAKNAIEKEYEWRERRREEANIRKKQKFPNCTVQSKVFNALSEEV
jgi:hypothetical protein